MASGYVELIAAGYRLLGPTGPARIAPPTTHQTTQADSASILLALVGNKRWQMALAEPVQQVPVQLPMGCIASNRHAVRTKS